MELNKNNNKKTKNNQEENEERLIRIYKTIRNLNICLV